MEDRAGAGARMVIGMMAVEMSLCRSYGSRPRCCVGVLVVTQWWWQNAESSSSPLSAAKHTVAGKSTCAWGCMELLHVILC